MTKAMYPGSFDPITVGHMDIIERASKLFDEVVVAIMINPKKTVSFTQLERKEFIEKSCKHLKNVKVVIGHGLTIQLAQELDINILIRGIRAVVDYEYELQQATSNMMLAPNIETVFLVSKPEYSFLSSSISKEIATYGGDISKFIPDAIHNEVIEKLKKK